MLRTDGLGALASLPRELRDQIYTYFMHWAKYKGDREAQDRRCSWDTLYQLGKLDSLAILRASRQIHNEASALLYENWTLDIRTSLATVADTDPTDDVDASWPAFFPQVSHPKHGTFKLPIVWTRPLEGDLYWPIYLNMRFERWRSVVLEFPAPSKDTVENPFAGLMIAFRMSQIAAVMFQKHPPPSLLIDATRSWSSLAEETSILPHEIAPLNRSVAPLNAIVSALHIQGMELELAVTDPERQNPVEFEDRDTRALIAKYVECWFDWQLDNFEGPENDCIRANRWIFWNAEYERTIINAAQDLDPVFRTEVFSALTERWAVLRAMHPNYLYLDTEAWQGNRHDFARMPSPATRVPLEEFEEDGCFENIGRNDPKFNDYLEAGFFHRRRIQITETEIRWDPDHWLGSTSSQLPRAHPSVLFANSAPTLPMQDRRPGR